MNAASLIGEASVREAYAAHGGELYGFAMRSLRDHGLAEEAVQETFVRAWRAGDRFDPESGSLPASVFGNPRHVLMDLRRPPPAPPGGTDNEPHGTAAPHGH